MRVGLTTGGRSNTRRSEAAWKWAALTKSSNDLALREIRQLIERGILIRSEAGVRSSTFSLAIFS